MSCTANLRRTASGWLAAALCVFLALPSAAAEIALAIAESCAVGADGAPLSQTNESRSVLLPLDLLGVAAGTETLTLTLLEGDREIFTETYRLAELGGTAEIVLEAWLGGFNSPGMRSWEPTGDGAAFAIEARSDGVTLSRLSLGEALAADQALRGQVVELAPVTAVDVYAAEDEIAEAPQLFRQSTFVCPNAIPYCDYEYDACENQCYSAGANVSAACLQACNDDFLSCYYGEPVIRTVLTPVRQRQDGFSCRQKNCTGLPRQVEDWSYQERQRTYTSTYCRTTGQTHNEVLTSSVILPTTKFCFKDQPVLPCPFGVPQTGCYYNSDLCPF